MVQKAHSFIKKRDLWAIDKWAGSMSVIVRGHLVESKGLCGYQFEAFPYYYKSHRETSDCVPNTTRVKRLRHQWLNQTRRAKRGKDQGPVLNFLPSIWTWKIWQATHKMHTFLASLHVTVSTSTAQKNQTCIPWTISPPNVLESYHYNSFNFSVTDLRLVETSCHG